MAGKNPRTPTTAPTPKALRGGASSFNEDGSWPKPVCDAIRHIKSQSDRVSLKLENATTRRNALKKEIVEKGEKHAQHADLCVDLVKQLTTIDKCRAELAAFVGSYANMVQLADEGELDLEADPKILAKQAIEYRKDDDEDDEEDDDAKSGQLKLTQTHQPGPNESFETHAMQTPGAFGGRDFDTIKPHLQHLNSVTAETKGTQAWITPLRLARWIEKQFAHHKTTENRREIFPKMPEWFRDSILGIVARCATGEINKGHEGEEVDAGTILNALTNAAAKDVEAWLHLVGGKTADINKTILATAKAS